MEKQCRNCGTMVPEGARFCSNCGSSDFVVPGSNSMGNPYGQYSQSVNRQMGGQQVSKKEFIEKYAQPSLRNGIKSTAILCYVIAGINFAINLEYLAYNPLVFLDPVILLGLALGMHLGKSSVCAILILVVSIIEVVVSVAFIGSFPYLWLIAGISAVVSFNKINKEYKRFINGDI